MFSEKATKIWKNLPLVSTLLSKHQNKWEIFFKKLSLNWCWPWLHQNASLCRREIWQHNAQASLMTSTTGILFSFSYCSISTYYLFYALLYRIILPKFTVAASRGNLWKRRSLRIWIEFQSHFHIFSFLNT